MRRLTLLIALIALVIAGAAPVFAGRGNARNFTAHLAGGNEVPAVATGGQGQAIFHVSKDGTTMSYKLIVANIDEMVQAHIHLAPPGQNGGVVTFLFGPADPSVTTNGVLAQGTITDDDLVGALAGKSLDDLVAELANGNAYVNVHTEDFPNGEIRGQIN